MKPLYLVITFLLIHYGCRDASNFLHPILILLMNNSC